MRRQPICLIGLPGSGKSTVGRHIARRLQLNFSDSDRLIEARLGCSILAYFEQEGEARFRDVEQQVIDELTLSQDCIIATGGGAVLRSANRDCLRDRSTVIYLRAQPEFLLKRVSHDSRRPLLQGGDPLLRLRELYEMREPLYLETAHFVIETGRPSIPALVNLILTELNRAGVTPAA